MHDSLLIIQKAMQFLINCNTSLRSITKILEISQGAHQKIPHISTIRNLFLRIGLYELKRKKEYRNVGVAARRVWIFIIDLTVELGNQKARVILGVSRKSLKERLVNSSQGLSHLDVEILAWEIMNSTKGELIEKKLNVPKELVRVLSEKVGNPIQIVADHASDLACGIKRYQKNHPEVIYTHDDRRSARRVVTHGMVWL